MTFLRVIMLSFVLVASAFSGAVAQATAASPTPPTATAVVLNTYGSLPVIVLNLTQSPINFNLSTNSTAYGSSLPLAAGLSGVYYPNGTSTSTFTNVLNPSTAVDPAGVTSASLTPVATLTGAGATFSNTYGWASMFTVFPSWTQRSGIWEYEYVQYVALNPTATLGAAAATSPVVAGYPSGNAKNITQNGQYINARALNASQPAVTSINLNLMANGQTAATYKININSLGGGTSGSVPVESQSLSILEVAHIILDITTDIVVVASGDVLGIVDLLANVPSMINGISDAITNTSHNTNITGATADYHATSAGINITATGSIAGATFTPVHGDSQSLTYEVQPSGNQTLPLIQQNAVLVTTWRQPFPGNTSSNKQLLPSGSDVLFLTVINQGVYASNQVQQYINNNSASQMASDAKYHPTKEQAQDSSKILKILTAIAKQNPQDAKYIMDMFGLHGKYAQIKNDPVALKNMHSQLKAIFDKYRQDLPEVASYSVKLNR